MICVPLSLTHTGLHQHHCHCIPTAGLVFSPKELHMSLMECLQKVNFCENSFIQESFVVSPDTVKIDLLHHEFIKHRDHQKWFLYHIVLGPEQCFHLKSIHLERDEWKVQYYDELILRTFEPSSIFVTLPPGISISQVVGKMQCCHLREACVCIAPSQRTPNVGTTHAGLKEQLTPHRLHTFQPPWNEQH